MPSTRTRLAALAFLSCATVSAAAQDSGPLIDLLVRKGILTEQEAAEVRREIAQESSTATIAEAQQPAPAPPKREAEAPAPVTIASRNTNRLTLGGRLQVQYAGLSTDIDNAADPASTSHLFLRRAYLTTKADLSESWSLGLTYDLAADGFDNATIRWEKHTHTIDVGLRKVNNAFEELSSSGAIKAIERSSATRYFVEPNNGRRLGAGGYRVGLFYEGQTGNVFYGAAVTNPERTQDFTFASSSGDASNNNFAYWVNAGMTGTFSDGGWRFGLSAASQPDQGGPGADGPGRGFDLALYTAHADLTLGRFNLFTEFFLADVERGASLTRDAQPFGWFLQPSFMITDQLELVARYSFVDSDGRGISLSDAIRSAPSGGTMDQFHESYLGGTYYFLGNDLKLQMGYVHGRTGDALSGADAEATVHGLRSQLQLQF